MFCPICYAYLTEEQLIKTNVRKFQDIPIEYDARCPNCTQYIGRMFWGRLQTPDETPAPGQTPPERQTEPQPDPAPRPEPEPPTDEPPRNTGAPADEPEPEEPVRARDESPAPLPGQTPYTKQSKTLYCCPHCGKPLPEDPSQLPRKLLADI